MGDASVQGRQSFPARVSDGTLVARDEHFDNLLLLPLEICGPVEIELEFETGSKARIVGDGANVRLIGEEEFVENVPCA